MGDEVVMAFICLGFISVFVVVTACVIADEVSFRQLRRDQREAARRRELR
jgi:hypothetical protein